ncbi:MAG: AAA family ATPase [Verrucomicrobiales bacterium]
MNKPILISKFKSMLIKNLKVSRLLSFGPQGIDLPMRSLNVFIGPNGSGKSNLIEVLNLLRYVPARFDSPIMSSGGMQEWRWKGEPVGSPSPASLEFLIDQVDGSKNGIRHAFGIEAVNNWVLFDFERIEHEAPFPGESTPWQFYSMKHGEGILYDGEFNGQKKTRELGRSDLDPTQSILSQMKDPGRYKVFAFLENSYNRIRIYNEWTFGRAAIMRSTQKPDGPIDAMGAEGRNFVSIFSSMSRSESNRFVTELRNLYPDIINVRVAPSGGGAMRLFVEEREGIEIPAERLSDGTLRFMFLLAILLDPKPPRLIAIDEPELGLHPDVIPKLADLLLEASTRTQIVVTTHSRMLVDALGDDPESVVVCEKHNGETTMTRLDSNDLEEWLKTYSLGDLWSKGEIGGNRW